MEGTWFEIFRTGSWNGGRYDEASGTWVPYSEADLDTMVANFERRERDIPLILGHNHWSGEEKPALGWVAALRRVGDRLLAQARDVKEELKDAVNRKLYPKRSVEIYENLDGKGLMVSAVAFLGSQQPAVPGMPDFVFGAWGDGRRVFTLCDFRDGLVVPAGPAGEVVQEPNQEGGEAEMNCTAEQFAALEAENRRLKEEAEASARERAELERKGVAEECRRYVSELVKAKKITPAVANGDGSGRIGLAKFMEGLTEEQRKQIREILNVALDALSKALESLDTEVDDAGERDGEDEASEMRAFAAQHGLDPKELQRQMARQR